MPMINVAASLLSWSPLRKEITRWVTKLDLFTESEATQSLFSAKRIQNSTVLDTSITEGATVSFEETLSDETQNSTDLPNYHREISFDIGPVIKGVTILNMYIII